LDTPGGFDSRIIRYVRDGRTDRRTDKSNAYCHIPTVGGITRNINAQTDGAVAAGNQTYVRSDQSRLVIRQRRIRVGCHQRGQGDIRYLSVV